MNSVSSGRRSARHVEVTEHLRDLLSSRDLHQIPGRLNQVRNVFSDGRQVVLEELVDEHQPVVSVSAGGHFLLRAAPITWAAKSAPYIRICIARVSKSLRLTFRRLLSRVDLGPPPACHFPGQSLPFGGLPRGGLVTPHLEASASKPFASAVGNDYGPPLKRDDFCWQLKGSGRPFGERLVLRERVHRIADRDDVGADVSCRLARPKGWARALKGLDLGFEQAVLEKEGNLNNQS